jgi:hypothetical protein
MDAPERPTPPPYRRRSRRDLKPGESPLKYYEGWHHFWLFGVRREVSGLNRRLARHPYLYSVVALSLGAALVAAGLLYGSSVSDEGWPAPTLAGAGSLCLILGIGGLISALAQTIAARKDGQG